MENQIDNKIYGNAFNLIEGLGPASLTKLFKFFGDFKSAWQASSNEFLKAGLSERLSLLIANTRETVQPEIAFEQLLKHQIEIITFTEPSYPQLLKEIPTPPPLLYIRGNKLALNQPGIGVVGSRKITQYGQLVTDELVTGLVQNNFSIISGLAFGVDAQALNMCVTLEGTAIAVLASPLANYNISPRLNFELAQKIMTKGCLVSEYPLGFSSLKQNFPARNRIISGLSLGTLIIEADVESGSLITAKFALEQNREVFAVPGSIFSPTSRGTNALIKQGAKLVGGTADILDELNINAGTVPEAVEALADEEASAILNLLPKDGLHINEIVKQAGFAPAKINAKLTILEMKGRIKNLGGGNYAKIR
jgi:DNA processing protein